MKFSWNTLNKDQILAIPKFGVNLFSTVLVLESSHFGIYFKNTYKYYSLVVGLLPSRNEGQGSILSTQQKATNHRLNQSSVFQLPEMLGFFFTGE